ncbi:MULTISPECIES: hypothetical protein [Clavibacter]|uniref:hypothetical protein n=1 Tax=Clavibacter TaxID=1573 RepID=UPI000A8E42B2|nr:MULTISPECIES: hypothetical protein [Clavibacter]MDA3804870.1 hypothetical protein [Clavibacter sp. CT19]
MRRAVDPHDLPLVCGVVALGSACIATAVLAVLTVGGLRFRQLLLADPAARPSPANP